MDKTERIKMVKAMEFIVRQVNNEDCLAPWLSCGVADGDISYGATNADADDVDGLDIYYEDDEDFAELMGLFLRVMKRACADGGLYCDKVVSK